MANVYDLNGKAVEQMELPGVFSTPYRPDVIQRAVLSAQSSRRQPYGSDPLAGKKTSAHYHGRRKYRFTMMNREMARIARVHGKVGYMAFRARFVPQAVKGRRAHPPKAAKVWEERINAKEKRLALISALAAGAQQELVTKRGHKVGTEVPIIFVDNFENLARTKDVKALLEKLLPAELTRSAEKKVRAGRGKMRGRRYKTKKGPLIIVSRQCDLVKAARNIPGIDVATPSTLGTELLAPGTHAGRFLILTKAACAALEKKYGA
ncbi:MAG: 50S ribosomal protein L4 [Candidatus Aenigmarchaeota archaeon]|nr:50S ribosomal protein L4 [Candidatus Aenigmarchaeota archaeon]